MMKGQKREQRPRFRGGRGAGWAPVRDPSNFCICPQPANLTEAVGSSPHIPPTKQPLFTTGAHPGASPAAHATIQLQPLQKETRIKTPEHGQRQGESATRAGQQEPQHEVGGWESVSLREMFK